MDTNSLDIAFWLISAAIAVLALWIISIEYRMRRIFKDSKGLSIEDILTHLHKKTADHDDFRSEITKYLKTADERITRSVQGVGVVRFNPFKDAGGGNQSFAVALLNEDGDGVVLSSLYTRDRVSVYAKPIEKNASSFELTTEEKEALAKATKK